MARESTIFGLRFNSNADLNPTREDLRVFLERTTKPGSRELHQNDLVRYNGLLEGLYAFEGRVRSGSASQDIREKMFYAVLSHSQFFAPGLKLAVEQFKYHLHDLASIDLVKPAAFIKSAESEMAKLNPKKKEEFARLARLQGMVEERKRALDTLAKHRPAVIDELNCIAQYVRDNLCRIERRCKVSIAILVDPQVSQQKEKQLIDGIKDRFKAELRDSLHNGRLCRKDLEIAKRDVDLLSSEVSLLLQQDVDAMRRLYEAVHEHARHYASEIDRMLAERRSGKDISTTKNLLAERRNGKDISTANDILAEHRNGKDISTTNDVALFTKLERVLVSLVSNYRFELRTASLRSETAHDHVLRDTRKELLLGLASLLERDRRALGDRRSGEDRRRRREPDLRYVERRKGIERRSGRSRRCETLDM